MASVLRARVLLRAPALLRAPVRNLAADALKPIPTPTSNLIWLERELSQISNSQGAQISDLQRQTHSMAEKLKRVELEHANSVSEFKRTVGTTSWRVCIVGGSFLLTILTVFHKE